MSVFDSLRGNLKDVTAEEVGEFRRQTGAGVYAAKTALEKDQLFQAIHELEAANKICPELRSVLGRLIRMVL